LVRLSAVAVAAAVRHQAAQTARAAMVARAAAAQRISPVLRVALELRAKAQQAGLAPIPRLHSDQVAAAARLRLVRLVRAQAAAQAVPARRTTLRDQALPMRVVVAVQRLAAPLVQAVQAAAGQARQASHAAQTQQPTQAAAVVVGASPQEQSKATAAMVVPVS
jgi:hypothetical protein